MKIFLKRQMDVISMVNSIEKTISKNMVFNQMGTKIRTQFEPVTCSMIYVVNERLPFKTLYNAVEYCVSRGLL